MQWWLLGRGTVLGLIAAGRGDCYRRPGIRRRWVLLGRIYVQATDGHWKGKLKWSLAGGVEVGWLREQVVQVLGKGRE